VPIITTLNELFLNAWFSILFRSYQFCSKQFAVLHRRPTVHCQLPIAY
jgi:hypothetical protein